jgi:hypothetical protein
MHHPSARQGRTTQPQSQPPFRCALFLHLKPRRQKHQRTHKRQQHARSRYTPCRYIRIHQHQRGPRDRYRHPHREQRHRTTPRRARNIASRRQQPRRKQRHPKRRQMHQQQNPLHSQMQFSNQPSHRRRKEGIPQMPHNKLRPMRIQPRIKQPLDLRQIHAAIFCIRMVATHQQRKKGQGRHQHSRKTSFPPVLFAFKPLRRDGCC